MTKHEHEQLKLVKRYSDDIQMEFGLDKCAKCTFVQGQLTTSEILQYSASGEANEYTNVKICNLCFFSARVPIFLPTTVVNIKKRKGNTNRMSLSRVLHH